MFLETAAIKKNFHTKSPPGTRTATWDAIGVFLEAIMICIVPIGASQSVCVIALLEYASGTALVTTHQVTRS